MSVTGSDSRISAIVVTYYTGPLLARAVASLKAQPEIGEIIVVDNGNWEGAVEQAVSASRHGAPVEVITGQGNVGFAAACNLGAKRARGEFLLFLNPDAVLPQGAAAQLLEDGADLKRPWLIGAKLINPDDGSEQQGSRRATLTPWRAFVEATRLYALAPRHPYFRRFHLHHEPCPAEVTPTPTISGACFFLPRADYFAVGGMDERYFLHVEDIDFCLRFAKEAGGRVYFDPHVAVPHYKSSSRVSPIGVEAKKTASINRYFRRHFSDPYPPPFLWIVEGVLWAAFAAKAARRAASRTVALLDLRARRGGAVARRARSLNGRRSER